ncbi:MAG: prepilin-type N-terminal cleavage/methylation domain-containing protein [bacterium]|nr:prepilin-type N-terminal cleavage/methylation domain-containing protein [bacterium]
MKKLNSKGFTLIELLAVIVILAIILIIAVPTVLDASDTAKESALQSSAEAVAKFYGDQYVKDNLVDASEKVLSDFTDGKARCITTKEAEAADLVTTEYLIASADASLANYDSSSGGTPPCSYVVKSASGKFIVTLVGTTTGKYSGVAPKTSS